jgi:ribosomal protein L10
MVEGRVVDVSGITALATLPSKEELFCEVAVVDQCAGPEDW